MPVLTPFPSQKARPPIGAINPASGLCDEFFHAGYFIALTVDANGVESLAFIPHRPDGDIDPDAGGSMARVSKLFATDANFRAGLVAYLRDAKAVYSMPPVRKGPSVA